MATEPDTDAAAAAAPEPAPAPVAAPATAAAAAPATASQGRSSRRRFLGWLGGLTVVSTAAMVMTPVVAFLIPSKSGAAGGGGKVLVGTTADIPAGSGKVVAMGSKPAIVVNTDQGVKAYSAICTHLGCVVAWNDMIGVIQCPCHDGHFNPATGAVVSGPPPNPLPTINVSVEGDQIYLTEA
jgi:cytochrome b6-f complex iron-sulfur subunit